MKSNLWPAFARSRTRLLSGTAFPTLAILGLVGFGGPASADPWHVSTGTETATDAEYSTTTDATKTVTVDRGATAEMTGGKITTSGTDAFSLYVEGTANLRNVEINADVVDSSGGYSRNSAVWIDGGDVTLEGGTVNATTFQSPAITVKNGGSFTSSADITGVANGTPNGNRAVILVDQSHLKLTGGTVRNIGGFANRYIVDVRGDGATAHIEDTNIAASAATASALFFGFGYNTAVTGTVINSNITTDGEYGIALQAQNGSQVQVTGSTISTLGQGGHGLWAVSGSDVTITDTDIKTAGIDADGISVDGSAVTITDTNVTTTGAGGTGLRAYDGNVTMTGGSVTVGGAGTYGVTNQSSGNTRPQAVFDGTAITTTGRSGIALGIFGSTDTVLKGGSSAVAKGESAYGAYVTSGGKLTLVDSSITSEKLHGLAMTEGAELELDGGTIRSSAVAIQAILANPGTTTIDASNKSRLTQNNGTLLNVTRGAGVGSSNVNFVLREGSVASGSVIDGNTTTGGTDVTIASGAVLKGGFQGVRNVRLDRGGWVIAGDTGVKSLTLGNGGGVIDTDGRNAAILVGISGAGGLTKQGSGLLTLSGASTYSGQTSIDAGGILLTGSLASDVTVSKGGMMQIGDGATAGDLRGAAVNNGSLVFNQPGNYDFSGALSGNGSLVKQGAGSLTLSGDYTYTGSTVLEDGSVKLTAALDPGTDLVIDGGTFDLSGRTQKVSGLSGKGGQLALGNGFLTVHQSGSSSFGGSIDGTGSFTKSGSGNLNLTGRSTFSGSTFVYGGTLSVNGSLANSNVNVGSNGILGGNGTVGGIVAQSGGTVSPGNSIGTLNVAGDVDFEAGSIYRVEIDAAGKSDRIAATGTGTLSGGTVQVLAEAGAYMPTTTYIILTAAGGVNGRFADVSSNLAFFDAGLDYTATDVLLSMTRNEVEFAEVAETANQIATAGAVEALASGNALYDAVVRLDEASARAAFDLLSGEVHASTVTGLAEDSRHLRNAANDRLRHSFGAVGTSAAPDAGEGISFWTSGFGSWGSTDGDGNAAATDRRIGGVLFGADTGAFDGWRFGVFSGYSHSAVDLDPRASWASVDSYHVGLYGGTERDAFSFRGGIAYSWADIDTRRSADFLGFADSMTAGYDGHTVQAFGEIGYAIEAGATRFEPFVNLAHVHVRTDGFTEKGGAAALSSSGNDNDTTFTTLGLRGDHAFGTDAGHGRLVGTLGWRHAFGDTEPSAKQAFAGSDAFTIAGSAIARNALVIEAGLEFDLSPTATLGISYNGQIASDARDHGVRANLGVKF